MINTTLPRRRYGTGDYTNLDPESIGAIIPIGYGTLVGLLPVEIDTTTHKWKAVDQAVAEFTEIRSATKHPMVKDLDYTEDLAKGEFTLIFNEYLAAAGETYYFSVEGDYVVSGTNYLGVDRNDGSYADGQNYTIDSGDSWQADGTGKDLIFTVYGKATPSTGEIVVAQNATPDPAYELGLKDEVNHSKLGQSFKVPSVCFITRIVVTGTIHGTLTGKKLRATLWSDVGITQMGPLSGWADVGASVNIIFPERNENEVLACDIKVPSPELTKVADILADMMTTVMGKSAALLDATALANLAADRTQDIKIYLGNDTATFGNLVAKLEAGQIWKLIPKQDGSYLTEVKETGEPANTPHFRDDDFLSFKMELDVGSIRQAVTVFYDEAEVIGGDYSAVQVSSQIARFFYMNESEFEVETYLKILADADALADDYLAHFEVPIIRVVFEVHGWALDLLPFRDKVKITRTRAAYAGGTLAGVLFRIEKLVKKPETNVVEITAAIWANSAV